VKHALYIVGEPGVGKSTLVETLVGRAPVITGRKPLAHRTYLTTEGGVTELGAREPGRFGGTDALSMSAVVPAEAWVTDGSWHADSMLLAEGDRLACDRFFNALLDGGWKLRIIHLDSPEHAAARRAARAKAMGVPPQKDTWLKGRRTKVQRLVERWSWDATLVTLDARESPDNLALQVTALSPVAANLYAGKEIAA
jgi:ABC-type cobalamin/Fe3+-siderophores transport system ATPase subunit